MRVARIGPHAPFVDSGAAAADAAVHTGAASGMFAAAARMLRPGGELWSVYNSHLRYKGELNRVVGPTQMAAQNPKFTVARSVARG